MKSHTVVQEWMFDAWTPATVDFSGWGPELEFLMDRETGKFVKSKWKLIRTAVDGKQIFPLDSPE